MVDILASHETTFETIFKAATDIEGPEQETYIPADFNCPSGGDQLTRVRFMYELTLLRTNWNILSLML